MVLKGGGLSGCSLSSDGVETQSTEGFPLVCNFGYLFEIINCCKIFSGRLFNTMYVGSNVNVSPERSFRFRLTLCYGYTVVMILFLCSSYKS